LVVNAVDRIDDDWPGRHHHADRLAQQQAHVIEGPNAAGIGGGHHDRVAVAADRQ